MPTIAAQGGDIVVPRPSGEVVGAVMAKVEKALRGHAPMADEVDPLAVGYGMMAWTSSTGRTQSHKVGLVRAEDWADIGVLVSRSRAVRGWRVGYLRAVVAGRVYEAFADEGSLGITALLRDGRVLGWWRATDFSYEGRFAVPLVRELWAAGGRRIGVLESANVNGGCAALEVDPDGAIVVPLRVRAFALIRGSPWREIAKLTPFGRGMGPREPNLDTVLAKQAAMLDPEEIELLFAGSLCLRGMECVKAPSSD
jgi:hypothetical protein